MCEISALLREDPMPLQQVFSAYGGEEDGDLRHFKFCPLCGTELVLREKGGRQRQSCPNCDFVHYRNPLPGVVVVVEKDGHVLLGKRKGGYGKGKWGSPQGFIEFDEDFLSAAKREVEEETGLVVEIRSILNVVSNLLEPQFHTLAIVLLAHIVTGEPKAGDDLESVEWFPLSGPLPQMAFEADRYVIERIAKMKDAEGLPVDPDFARGAGSV